MNDSVRLLCVHQNRLFRQCLLHTLSSETGPLVLSELDDTDSSYERSIAKHEPDLVLVQLTLPERQAVGITRYVRQTLAANVALLIARDGCTDETEHLLLDCVEAGAQGFVMEDSSLDDLQSAVQRVLDGEYFCSPSIMAFLMSRLADYSRESRWRLNVKPSALTQRELEILYWIAEGLSNKQVANQLSLSLYTVKNHVHRILGKLQVSGRSEAVRYALDQRWLGHMKDRDSLAATTCVG